MDEHPVGPHGDAEGLWDALAEWLWDHSSAIGVGFIAISAFVFIFSFPFRLTHNILIEALVPIFNVEFAVVYGIVQLGLGVSIKSWQAVATVVGVFLVGMGLAWIGMHTQLGYGDVEVEGFTVTRHILCGGSVISGFGLGLGLFKGWFWHPDHR